MSISKDDIQKAAHLARLEFDPSQLEAFQEKIGHIIDMVDELSQLDTDGVEPMSHPMDVKQRLRPDEVTEPNVRDEAQAIAPMAKAGLYLVPKVIEAGDE